MRRILFCIAMLSVTVWLGSVTARTPVPPAESEYFVHQFAGYLRNFEVATDDGNSISLTPEDDGTLTIDFNDTWLSELYMTMAVYDVLEDGFVDGNDTAYSAAWNGIINAPSMNAVYDELVALAGDYLAIDGSNANTDIDVGIYDINAEKFTVPDDGITGTLTNYWTYDDTADYIYTVNPWVGIGTAAPEVPFHIEGDHISTKGLFRVEGTTHGMISFDCAENYSVAFLMSEALDPKFQFGWSGVADVNSFFLQVRDYTGGGGTDHTVLLIDVETGDWEIPDTNFTLSDGDSYVYGTTWAGDDTNGTDTEADGTVHFTGDATVWKDANLGAGALTRPTATQPGDDTFKDEGGGDTGIAAPAFSINDHVGGTIEIPHDYKEGTDIFFHVHWQGSTGPTGTDYVQWQLIYTVGQSGATLDAATTITLEVPYDTQYEFKQANFAAISGTNFNMEDQVLFDLKRIAAAGDAYAGDAITATVGFHYEVDTVGSRSIAAK